MFPPITTADQIRSLVDHIKGLQRQLSAKDEQIKDLQHQLSNAKEDLEQWREVARSCCQN